MSRSGSLETHRKAVARAAQSKPLMEQYTTPPRYLTSSNMSAVWRAAKDHLDKTIQLAQ